MSHELDTVNGNVAMAYNGETPWHGLGVEVGPDLSPVEMMQAANVNWEVEKRLMSFQDDDDNWHSTGQYALVRTDKNKVLTTVGKGWNPVQNTEAFEFFKEFVDAGDMQMHTAGAIKGGRYVWALAKVNESFELPGRDVVESYLLFTNPHQFGKAIDVRFTPIRVVCNNTLSASIRMKNQLKVNVNHRTKFNPEQVKEVLFGAKNQLNEYRERAEFLFATPAKDEDVVNFFNEIFPVTGNNENKKEVSLNAKRCLEVLETQPGAESAMGTWWNAFNATTFIVDHVAGRNPDTRLQSAWYGTNATRKGKALSLAMDYAKAA